MYPEELLKEMSELKRASEQLQRSFAGEAWHGPSVLEVLEGMSAAEAASHPVAAAHSIWEIVLHLAGLYRVVLRRLGGDGTPMTPEEDWPPVPGITEAAWAATLQNLKDAHEELLGSLADGTDDALERPVGEGSSTLYITLHGMAQHNSYHAGQIALLRKAFA